jgi:tRNA A-37 threonylcarbamoyl transferase component Bud32
MTAQAIAIDGVRWTLSPAGQGQLSADDLRLNEHLAAGRASVVKHGEHRTVYRVQLPNGVVYWKHCRLNGSRAWWRDAFRGPKARMEFDRLCALADRGIATIQPLAWGRFDTRWPKGSFLITRAIENAVPLDDYLLSIAFAMSGEPDAPAKASVPSLARQAPRLVLPTLTPKLRRMFTLALAEFVGKLHAAGVTHPDLHPGNMLVRENASDWQFYLIDVHDVKLGPPLSREARLANLTLLNRWFQLRVARSDRLRFWRAYAGQEGSDDEARELELRTDRSVMKLWESRDPRCLRENRHFRRVRGDRLWGFAVRDLDADVERELAANLDAPFGRVDAILVKDSRSATVCLVTVQTSTGPRAMIYKRFRVRHWSEPLANLFRRSHATRSWVNGHALLDRGLPTPRPWLVLHRTRLGFLTVGYLLVERIPNARHLHEASTTVSVERKRQLIGTLARWIRLMHERGIAHRDLKAANILISDNDECQFIDLVGVRTQRRVNRPIRIRDLSRLNASFHSSQHVTRTDRLRFLRAYLLWSLRGKAGWEEWWKEIELATQKKIKRNARRNRPLA